MTFTRPNGAGLAVLAGSLFAATAAYAEPTVNKGDNAWMMTSTILVLLMIIPALRCFMAVWSVPRTCSRCWLRSSTRSASRS